EEALPALSGNDGRPRVAALDHELGRLHVQPGLRGGLVVAGEAVRLEEGVDVLVELRPFLRRRQGSARGEDDGDALTKPPGALETEPHFCAVVVGAGAASFGASGFGGAASGGAAFGFTETRIGDET